MPTPNPRPELLTLRWALILTIAFLVAVIFGGLTYLQAGGPAAVMAALSAAGVTVSVLHQVLGSR
jgi:hypothetical protein